MALVVARCNPGLRNAAASRRSQVQARPCRPVSFVRFARPIFARPAYRYGQWDEASAQAMRDMFTETSKQWRSQQGDFSGSVYWPGGGVTFKNGRWTTVNPNQTGKTSSSSSSTETNPSLPIDVVDAGEFYLLYADVPGLAKSDLSIKLSGPNKEPRVIKISGQRTNPNQQQQQEGEASKPDQSSSSTVLQQQRVFGSFSSSWELPADADNEGISAKVTDGVLTVTVPKKQQQPTPVEEEDEGQDIFVA